MSATQMTFVAPAAFHAGARGLVKSYCLRRAPREPRREPEWLLTALG
jgi:hypothetical protein